jgi:Icc-related predicted phosphoesterase
LYDWLVQNANHYDLVCLTGDFLDLVNFNQINSQLNMVQSALRRIDVPLALCSGNNDSFSEPTAPANLHQAVWLGELRRAGVSLDGDAFEVGGIQFRTIGWNAPIPHANADGIWLFHAPPARTPVSVASLGGDAGDEFLGEICRAGKGPALVLCGHQHHPQQSVHRVGRTWCANPGHYSGASMPNHIVIDTCAGKAVLRINGRDHTAVELFGSRFVHI